jgi:galactokinase
MQKLVCQHFRAAFGQPPGLWVKAPGRIILVGQHTGEAGGITLPFAIDRHFEFASARAGPYSHGPSHSVLAIDTDERAEIPLEPDALSPPHRWAAPIVEVISAFRQRGIRAPPIQAAFTGSLPLSPSLAAPAALSGAMALALDHYAGSNLPRSELARMCGFSDSASGAAVLMGKHDCALKLDARTLDHTYLPLRMSPYLLIFCHVPITASPLRPGAGSEPFPASGADDAAGSRETFRREESARVLEAEKALIAGDFDRLGKVLQASARSLARYWGPPEPETAALMEAAKPEDGVLGTASVGESGEAATLSLVHRDVAEKFAASVRKGYRARFGVEPKVLECQPADGASMQIL